MATAAKHGQIGHLAVTAVRATAMAVVANAVLSATQSQRHMPHKVMYVQVGLPLQVHRKATLRWRAMSNRVNHARADAVTGVDVVAAASAAHVRTKQTALLAMFSSHHWVLQKSTTLS
jgi:hypothetical protein